MKVIINDNNKRSLFLGLFYVLKNCSNIISIIFKKDHLFIQGMDKSHVCMFQAIISDKWLNEYSIDQEVTINVDAQMFYTVLNVANDNYFIELYQKDNDDFINIDLKVREQNIKDCFDKLFNIPLVENDFELMEIPEVEYDAEFSMSSKNIFEIANQMLLFGTDINICCSEEKIDLITHGVTGQMTVNIPIEDLNEYSIVEGEEINLNYSLSYIAKMCLTNKLTNNIEFCISSTFPMKIKYDLGEESSLVFYIAPKIKDDN